MQLPFQPGSPDELRQIVRGLREAAPALQDLNAAHTIELLQRLGERWQPGSDCFEQARALLSGTFSPAAVEAALQNLALALSGNNLQSELDRELGRHDLLERWQPDESGRALVRGFPMGVVAQVLAGNVFLNGIIGVAQCLLTRNAALLRISRRDTGLTALFVKSLWECDRSGVLQRALAVCSWSSDRDDLNQVLRDAADALVVWGGTAAVAAYSQDRCQGRVIHYGPRLGIGFVLAGTNPEDSLPQLAWDIALWEQQACSSPRVVFVEDRDGDSRFPREIAARLNVALTDINARLQPRELSLDEKSEVLSIREFAEWRDAAEVLVPQQSMSHTVLYVPAVPQEIPVGYRTVLVVPLRKVDDIPQVLRPYREVLQTAVLAAPPSRWPQAVGRLAAAGVTQVAAVGSAASRFLGLPHEGEFSLRRLVKLVAVDLGSGPLCSPARDAAQLDTISDALAPSQ